MSTTDFTLDGEYERDDQVLQEVQHFEGDGGVINEWYSMPEYVSRRHGFLGKHPEYKSVPKLGQSTVWDGDIVFGLDPSANLSVQEIRRRELKYEIGPLLPLPTTTNTQTLDDYSAYPAEEWQPGAEIPTIIISSPFATLAKPVLQEAGTQSPAETSGDLLNPASQFDDLATTTSPTTAGPAGSSFASDVAAQLSQSPHFHTQGGSVTQQTTHASFLAPTNFGTSKTANKLSSTALTTNTMTAFANMSGPVHNPGGAIGVPKDLATLAKIIDDLARSGSLQRPDAPAQYRQRWTDASSLAARPVDSLVKSPPQHGKKRAAPDDDDVNGTPRPDSAMAQLSGTKHPEADTTSGPAQTPVAKKPKLIIKPPTPPKVDEAATTQTKDPSPRQKKKKKKTSATNTSSPIKRSSKANGKQAQRSSSKATSPAASASSAAPTTTTTTTQQQQPSTLDRIAAGEILPKTKTLAISAAAHRLTLLHTAHARTSRAHHPDFPPEFFDRANFSKDDLAKQNVVRCICGDTKDDKNPLRDREWVGCDNDECAVWQHVDCIGEAVPRDLENDAYLCHVCDPFRHRKVLKEVRKKAGGLPS